MNQNIIMVSHHLGGIGGVQKVVDQLAHRFAEDGNTVTVIGCGVQEKGIFQAEQKNYREVLLYDEDIFFTKPWLFFSEKYLHRKLEKTLRELLEPLDTATVILTNPVVYLLMEKVIKDYKDKVTFIGQMHSSADYVFECKGAFKVYPYIIKNKYKYLHHVLFLTKGDAARVAEAYQFPSQQVSAIANPISKEKNYQFDRTLVNENEVVFIGRLDVIKQLDHLVQVVGLLSKKYPNLHCSIYGTGPEEDRLKQLIQSQGLAQQITLQGFTTNAEGVFCQSLFSVLTSHREGFPISMLESIMNSAPVLSYNCSPGVELIQAGSPDLLVELDNVKAFATKMSELLANRTYLEEQAQKSFTYVYDTFSEDAIVAEWYQLIESLKQS